jgi:hypothetical protein
MPDSKNQVVKFGGVHWIASRPLLVAVLKDIKFCQSYGLLVVLQGTETQLIAAEVATPDLFKGISRYSERTCHDAHGDQLTMKYSAGKWDVRLFISAWGARGIPCDEHPLGDQPWWTVHGAIASNVTTQILSKLMHH